MSQEDGHREGSGDGPEVQGPPESADSTGAGGWAAPGQGSAPSSPEGSRSAPPSSGQPGYGPPEPPPGYAPPQGYGGQGYGGQAYGPQGQGTPPGYGAPGYGPREQVGAPGYGTPGYGPPHGQGVPSGYGQQGYGAPGYSAPGYGAPGQGTPGYGPHGQGGPPPGYGPPGQGGPSGYGPHGQSAQGPSPQPIKTGVVALRPMTLGDIFNGAFSYIRDNPRTTFVLALVVMAIASSVSAIASALLPAETLTSFDEILADPAALDPDDPIFQTSPLVSLLSLVGGLITLVGGAILLGLLAAVVAMAVLGRRLTVAEAWEAVRGQVGSIIGLAFIKLGMQIIMAIVFFIAMMIVVFVAVLLSFAFQSFGAAVAVGLLIVLVGIAAVAAPALWIWIRLYYAMPLVVLERLGPFQAIARSWRLSQGAWWRTFGYWLLALLIVFVVNLILGLPFGVVLGFDVLPYGDYGVVVTAVISYVITVLVYALTQPFLAGVNTLLYLDLRMRREGLDLHLQQAAQQGQAVGSEIFLPRYRT
ncbi:glycerophosphoryl diester phosphodiesterase membrane domain-containing protein [Nocardiopsis metallicus]|uniref:MFS family permease n=1 Tax=Nocardiopsis metallicus TaxID=179819 RepID=A0A840WLY1_9ACTN|nr:glycerophosphoryl diester phosphodiesterase membrane domain-containing protein [Nocardiopsis metallicus]MBB5492657.1 MFS family permease [Nocardiopsis metallicus]